MSGVGNLSKCSIMTKSNTKKLMFYRKYCTYRNLIEVRELLLQLNFLCV